MPFWTPAVAMLIRPVRRRRTPVVLRYVAILLANFRWTLLILAAAVVIGTILHALSRQPLPTRIRPTIGVCAYAAWMSFFAQPLYSPPTKWYLLVEYSVYPILGFILVGQGIVRLSLLMISKRRGEKEWMLVTASTYRDHVVLCGLGHLGFRVLEQLVQSDIPVVVLERSAKNPFVTQAKVMGVPVLIRDMKEDQALIDAGIQVACAVIIASNDDISNLEVAIDSRRMNPNVRIVMRLFDQQLASKIAGALTVDAAFSSAALAAPVVAAMSLKAKLLSSLTIGGESYVAAEIVVEDSSPLIGKAVAQVEQEFSARVLALIRAGTAPQVNPAAGTVLAMDNTIVVHVAAKDLSTLAAAARQSKR
jgi:Trk K+ transport system NAD-binding subunit